MNKEELEFEIKHTKQCRVELDEVLQKIKIINRNRQTSLAITKVQEAIMWLGMNLKELGNPNPYPDSYNPDNTNVAPTSDGLKF